MAAMTLAGTVFVPEMAPERSVDEVMEYCKSTFSFNDNTIRHFKTHTMITSLELFVAHFNNGEEITEFMQKMKVPEMEGRLQTARVLMAWEKCKKHILDVSNVKKLEADQDLEAPMLKPDRDALRESFWARHHVNYPVQVHPSDRVIDRLHKEMKSRSFIVFELRRVSTVTECNADRPKRKQTTDNFYVTQVDDQEQFHTPTSLDDYLQRLHTLLLGYSIAGAWELPNVTKETRTSVPSDYVFVPYDTVVQYFYRCSIQGREYASIYGYPKALQWLKKQDEAERKLWSQEMRNTSLPLGTIINLVMARTLATWQVPAPPPVPNTGNGASSSGNNDLPFPKRRRGRGGKGKQQQQQQQQNQQRGGQLAIENVKPAIDNDDLKGMECPPWNKGQCTNTDKCSKGMIHRCNKVLASTGKPCNMGHRAINCTRK